MTPCREFQGCRHKLGYGWRKHQGRSHFAHRVAYCEAKGIDIAEIKGKVVRHRCDNPACINPDHLELGTQADNVADMVAKGRQRGAPREAHGRRILTSAIVEEARRLFIPRHREFGASALARKHGVSSSAMSDAIHGRNWA